MTRFRAPTVLAAILALMVAALAPSAAVAAGPDRCPGPYRGGAYPRYPAGQFAAARAGSFAVLGTTQVRLVPPIDWDQDPLGSESWRSKLHSLEWVGPLLVLHSRDRQRPALAQARDIALDWIRSNPAGRGFAWADKITGERAEVLAYVIAAGQCAGILTPEQQAALRASAVEHGRFLSDPENLRAGNHALYASRGLMVLTGLLPTLPGAGPWRAAAIAGFREQLPVSPQGVGLEHSPGYHFKVLNLIASVTRLPGAGSPALRALAARMRRVAPWFVMPNGAITRLGDTAAGMAPSWARAASARLRGIAPTTSAGFGIVRFGRSYLSVTAGHHAYGHKQADELTFELFDRGRNVVTDTGRWGALRDDEDEVKSAGLAFTKSSQAHSVLLVDGRSWAFDGVKPYGSAVSAVGAGEGWYAIEGTNPLLASQGVSHRRLFLYRPGQALVVVDRVSSAQTHTYTRLFQFHPGIGATVTADRRTVLLRAPGFLGSLHTAPTPGDRGTSVVVGRRDPMLGFTTSPNRFVPFIRRAAVAYESQAASAAYVSVISLAGRGRASLVRSTPTSVAVRLTQAGRAPVLVSALRVGGRLRVGAAPQAK